MRSDASHGALMDMRDNILLAQEFVTGLDPVAFAADMRTLYAVTCCLEIISEASRRLGPEIQARHPGIPSPQVAQAGNVYRYEYAGVRPDVLWRTVHDALPPLLAAVEAELGAGS